MSFAASHDLRLVRSEQLLADPKELSDCGVQGGNIMYRFVVVMHPATQVDS